MQDKHCRGGSNRVTITVGLGGRSYDIVIGEGLSAEAGARIAACLPGARCAVVSDANVAALHLRPLKASLAEQGSSSARWWWRRARRARASPCSRKFANSCSSSAWSAATW